MVRARERDSEHDTETRAGVLARRTVLSPKPGLVKSVGCGLLGSVFKTRGGGPFSLTHSGIREPSLCCSRRRSVRPWCVAQNPHLWSPEPSASAHMISLSSYFSSASGVRSSVKGPQRNPRQPEARCHAGSQQIRFWA